MVSKQDLLRCLTNIHNNIEVNKNNNELCCLFEQIAQNFLKHKNFNGYDSEMKRDLCQEMVLKMYKYSSKYDVTKNTSPFAYFTQTAKNAAFDLTSRHYRYMNEKFDGCEELTYVDRDDARDQYYINRELLKAGLI